jgi:hypothetical protein
MLGPAELAARVQDGAFQQLSTMIDKVRPPNASDGSPKGGNPFVLRILIHI